MAPERLEVLPLASFVNNVRPHDHVELLRKPRRLRVMLKEGSVDSLLVMTQDLEELFRSISDGDA